VRRTVAIMTAIAALALAACSNATSSDGGNSTGAGAGPFEVAYLVGLSGPVSVSQQGSLQGAKAAAAVINRAGGILGHRVEITSFDDLADPTMAVSDLENQVLTSSWNLLMFNGPSSVSSALIPVAKSVKTLQMMVNVNPTYENNPKEFPYAFNVNATQGGQAAALVNYLQKQGYKSVGLLTGNDATGLATAAAIQTALKAGNVTTYAQSYDVSATDITPELLKLQQQHPDALVVSGYGAPAGHILTSLNTLGWNVPTIGDVLVGATDLPGLAPTAVLKNLKVEEYRVDTWVSPQQRTLAFRTFLAAVEKIGPIQTPLVSMAVGYDPLMLTWLAARQAKSTSPDAMVQALENLKISEAPYVVQEMYHFSATSHLTTTPASDYSIVPYSPLTDGMIGAPAS
jgi:branched-chain amino acid transport system substrate-binding protein